MTRRGWPLSGIALVVALALIGHDSAMAGQAHGRHGAAPPAAEDAAPHGVTEPGMSSASHEDSSDQSGDCGVLQPALPSVAAGGMASPAAIPILDFVDRSTTVSQSAWLEPRWPPGTRRAFFQVYRM
jgi:hypothetical protein